ncbi:MAG TPA: hypothetical protein PKX63_09480 [Niabella sp.]|nr:hypothetical protein [Niabella sp.]
MNNNHVSVWGRTLEEYTNMFGLHDILLSSRILSIADGPSTFNLQQRYRGVNVTSVDPIYNLSICELKEVFKKSYSFNKELFIENKESFNFKNEQEMEQVLAKRQNTFNTFIADYETQRNNYHFGKLPTLDFTSNSFDLCLCSNLLFIFDHIFDLEFHINSIKEMLRISNEVRIFPLYSINGQESNYLSFVTQFLTDNNYSWTIETNDYHIYKDGNRFLKVIKLTE